MLITYKSYILTLIAITLAQEFLHNFMCTLLAFKIKYSFKLIYITYKIY